MKTVNLPWSVRICGSAALAVPTLSLLFVLNKLTPLCNTLCLEILLQPALRLSPQVTPGMWLLIRGVWEWSGPPPSPPLSLHRRALQLSRLDLKPEDIGGEILRGRWTWKAGCTVVKHTSSETGQGPPITRDWGHKNGVHRDGVPGLCFFIYTCTVRIPQTGVCGVLSRFPGQQ